MQNATLMSHVDTDLVTREQLALVETPDATRSFKPVPHIELVSTLEDVLRENRIAIRKEQFALRRDGSTLFAVLQLAHAETADGTAALGLRTSNNRTMSIQICAGLSVFVCDNMVFRGDLIALNRKHTSRLYLKTELVQAVCPIPGTFRQACRRNRKSKGSAALGQRGESHAPRCLHPGHSADPLLARSIQSLFRTVCRRVQTPHRLEPAQCLHGRGEGNAYHHAHAGHSGTRTVFRHDERHE